jgi:FHS family L-fucose permease-like MFS transporter
VIGIGVLLWALLIAFTPFPESATRHGRGEALGGLGRFRELFGKPRYLFGVFAQFCYVGAQVGIWSFTIRYLQAEIPGTSEKTAANVLTLALVLFMAGRFIGTALMKWVKPFRLLLWFALADVVLCAFAAFAGGLLGAAALTLASFFMSVMFPTIFAGSIRGLGGLTKLGSSLIVMSIIGGAVLTAMMGKLSDVSGEIRLAMVIPLLCFIIVAAFASRMQKRSSRSKA